jgi:PTH1 family peptidyl-tRNA hydrolase
MKLIVGLGNPGSEYKNNRHNVGFMAIDKIASEHGFAPFKKKYKGLFADGKIKGERVVLLKPQTFMNKSGASVGALASFFKIAPSDIIVFYDELDLAAGKVRIKIGGGNGGHNGLRSIDPVIGKEYKRIRIGIDHPGHKDRVTRHVLGDFAKSDKEWLESLLETAAKNVDLLLDGQDAQFMNKMALAVFGEPKEKKKLRKKPVAPKQDDAPKITQKNKGEDISNPMADMLKKLLGRE